MFKKLTSLFLAVAICVLTAMSVSAEVDRNKIIEVSPIYVSSYSRDFGANSAVYADGDLWAGYTAIYGGSHSDGCYHLTANQVIGFTFGTSNYYMNMKMGYYDNDTDTFVDCPWIPRYDNTLQRYIYSCTITIPKSGNYKFFISNNTANTVTLLSPTISY